MTKRARIGDYKDPCLRGDVYYCDFRVGSKRHRISLKTSKKSTARERASAIYERLINTHFGLKPDITVAEVLDHFIEYKRGKISHKSDIGRAKNIQEFFGAETPLMEIDTKSQMENFMRYLKEQKNHKYNTIKHHMELLKAATNLAIQDKLYMGDNPACLVKLKHMKSRSVKFSVDEVSKILSYTRKVSSNAITLSQRYVYPFTYIAINTGMRAGEIFNLRFTDVKPSYIVIRDPKSQQEVEEIPNPPWLFDFINNLPKDSVFVINTEQRNTNTFRKTWLKMKRELKLHERSNWHALRHSFASYLASQNTPITVIQALLRHSDPSTTEIYLHKDFEEMREAMLKIRGIVGTKLSQLG